MELVSKVAVILSHDFVLCCDLWPSFKYVRPLLLRKGRQLYLVRYPVTCDDS